MTAMASLSQTATEDFVVADMLQAPCEAAATALPVDGVGVMLCRDGRNVFGHAAGAGEADVQFLERLQEALQTGPCADCIAQSSMVLWADLVRDGRWVEFQALAGELHLGAMVAIPLLSRGQGWGVLDLYRRTPLLWTSEELQAAQALDLA